MPPNNTETTQPPKPPRSDAQRRASQENGRKSRGPKTAAGKSRSSRNAFKLGLFSEKVAPWLTGDRGSRVELLAELKGQYNPHNGMQRMLVKQLADELMKIQAFAEMERALIEADTCEPDPAEVTAYELVTLRNVAQTLRELIEAPHVAPKDVTLSYIAVALSDTDGATDAATAQLITRLKSGHLADDAGDRIELLRQAEVAIHAQAEKIIQSEQDQRDEHRQHRVQQMNQLDTIAKIEQQITRATKRVTMLTRQLNQGKHQDAPGANDYIVTAQTM